MTKADLIEQMEQYPDDTVLFAFDGDEGEVMPVTGVLYTPGLPPMLEFQTDEP